MATVFDAQRERCQHSGETGTDLEVVEETVKVANEEDFLCIEIQKGRKLENQKRIRGRLDIHS